MFRCFILISIFIFPALCQDRPNQVCTLRCIAKCVESDTSIAIDECQKRCTKYDDPKLCSTPECWNNCQDLGPSRMLAKPSDIKLAKDTTSDIVWTAIANASMYVIQYHVPNQPWFEESYYITKSAWYDNIYNMKGDFCTPLEVRVSAVTSMGVSEYSKPRKLEVPAPQINPLLGLKEMTFINQPFVTESYRSNGTIRIVFEFQNEQWPPGQNDVSVDAMFHLINCKDPDLSQGIPMPDFVQENGDSLVGLLGADMMYRRCRFVYYAQMSSSKLCGSRLSIHSPPPDALKTLEINCDTVSNNNCVHVERFEAPVCGQIEKVDYYVMGKVDISDPLANMTLNVSFVPLTRQNESPTLYYVAFYGPATNYGTQEEETFLGVNMTDIMGEVSNCDKFDAKGICMTAMTDNFYLDGIHIDSLYGITICAVKDPRNLTFPDMVANSRAIRPKASKIIVSSKDYKKNHTAAIIGGVIGGASALIIVVVVVCCYINRKQKAKLEEFANKWGHIDPNDRRYTDMPRKQDIWEIERRNLIIYNEKKLGSGAFGAVYLGKLLGKSLGHKDSNSPLGVNIMRAENCEVAVKMLPEYADELSKSEFLREIGLMKTLGYHERLVNMMACITDSEPLCLVVEYCSDGDLLHFLRDRCKYMLKMDELGIDYYQPVVDNNYDIEMIMSMKQLLMFAVQISYGLEYLSQKGFVHRDVAARNILVHGKNACKIGDFGLCRYIYAESAHYKSKGGRLPLKWMSPEAIRHYEFTTQSDVWSFGILLFEIITLGGAPYANIQPEDMLMKLEEGFRMEQPDNCPDSYYSVMSDCWSRTPEKRPEFSVIRQRMATQLEEITEEYSYLKLDAQRDYYNVQYEFQKPDVIIIPEADSSEIDDKKNLLIGSSGSTSSIESIPMDEIIIDPNVDIDRTKAAIKAEEKRKREEQEAIDLAAKENEMNESEADDSSISISMGPVQSEKHE